MNGRSFRSVLPGVKRDLSPRPTGETINGGKLERPEIVTAGPTYVDQHPDADRDVIREFVIDAADVGAILGARQTAEDVPVDKVYAVSGPDARRRNRLAELREGAGLTRLELAELSYVPASLIARAEDHYYWPSDATREALASVLNVSTEIAFDGAAVDIATAARVDG